MLRRVFYGMNNSGLGADGYLIDAKPREIFITACLLVPIIGIGLYPKLAMQTYDVKTVAIATQVRKALPIIAQERPRLYSHNFSAPKLPTTEPQPLLGFVK